MNAHRTVGWWIAVTCVASVACGQDIAAGLDAARQKAEAKEWGAAFEVLIGLVGLPEAAAEAQCEPLAELFAKVGEGLRGEALFASALRAHEAALAQRKRLHGDRDHPDVAAGLDRVASCLRALGRGDEALPRYEESLAMYRRLHGDRDHPDVATSINNVAVCLAALGRASEALPRYEASLAMNRRLYGDQDNLRVAANLNNVAHCLGALGRASEALPLYEAALAMKKRLYQDRDDPDVALALTNVALCLETTNRAEQALPHHEASLAMNERLYRNRDHPDLVDSLNNLAGCQKVLGRTTEALQRYEAALAMRVRLHGGRDHPDTASSLNYVAVCLESLGRASEALPKYEASLAMSRRLYGSRDHLEVARGLNNVAGSLEMLGRASEALPQLEAALAMRQRLLGNRDHEDMMRSLNSMATCLRSLGRTAEALLHCEAALAMYRRLHGDRDHPDLALGLTNVALCLKTLGRASEALPQYEAAWAVVRRLSEDRDAPDVATARNNLAQCLESLGRATEALAHHEESLAMCRRLYGDRDHPSVATGLNNLGFCLESLARPGEALVHHEEALAMRQRLFGDRDHPGVAASLNNVAGCLKSLGRASEALPRSEAALAMRQRLFDGRDHPSIADSLNNVASCLQALGRTSEALLHCARACEVIERLRERSRISAELQQSWFDELKRGGAFERLQALASNLHRPGEAFAAAERSRSRELLDLLEQQRFDPLEEAELRARRRGDEDTAQRLLNLRNALGAAELKNDHLLRQLTKQDDEPDAERRVGRRAELLQEATAATSNLRQLLDQRARELGDVLLVGRVRTAAEVQSALLDGELFLEYTVTKNVALLYVFARQGEVEVHELPTAHATLERSLGRLLQQCSHAQVTSRGRDPDGGQPAGASAAPARELFDALIPKDLWPRLQSARRLFIAPHRALHRLPFEVLVTASQDGKPVHWLDNGPAVSYVSSGSVLHWLRQRAKDAGDDATSLDVLAVADPSEPPNEPAVPVEGALVLSVNDGGEGARAGLRPRDVLVRYDGRQLVDDATLRDARAATEASIEDQRRADTPIPLEVWRRGEVLQLQVRKGLLGIRVGKGGARSAHVASLGNAAQMAIVTRAGDLERLHQLPPLRGARAETDAIASVGSAKGGKVVRLVGAEATEPAVFDLAAKAKYLHFACHGIAEEYAGQSLSMLVLSMPTNVLPGDDGLLKLGDLFHAWRSRLSACRMVVLSACRTNIGPTLRDEAPQALPIGFMFAGAPAVISSVWAVDDSSTKELMTDFYGRLLAGETDKLAAFAAAKKALRAKYPDPFHWAPFLFVGSPE